MNSKTKFGLTISALSLVIVLLVIAVIAVSVYGAIKVSNFSFGFKTGQNINGTVQAGYSYAGQSMSMTTDGTSGGQKILNYNGEDENQQKQLKILNNEVIKLTKQNNFIVFNYTFTNSDTESSYLIHTTYTDTQKTDSNMTVLWGYSKTPVDNFEDLEDCFEFFSNPISGLEVKPSSTLYIYIKAQIKDISFDAEFSGDFVFNMRK